MIVVYSPTQGEEVSMISLKYYYYCWIYITHFSVTYNFVFILENFTTQNYRKKHLVIILCYLVRSSEPQVNLRYQPIVVSEVGLYLEIDW